MKNKEYRIFLFKILFFWEKNIERNFPKKNKYPRSKNIRFKIKKKELA